MNNKSKNEKPVIKNGDTSGMAGTLEFFKRQDAERSRAVKAPSQGPSVKGPVNLADVLARTLAVFKGEDTVRISATVPGAQDTALRNVQTSLDCVCGARAAPSPSMTKRDFETAKPAFELFVNETWVPIRVVDGLVYLEVLADVAGQVQSVTVEVTLPPGTLIRLAA